MIEVIVGPVSSGKSSELIRRVVRAQIAKKSVLVFKSLLDDRYNGLAHVCTHNDISIPALAVKEPYEILIEVIRKDLFDRPVDIVAIDEFQFFPLEIVTVVSYLADAGKDIILSGLDTDFRGLPFGAVPQLLALAEKVHKLSAVCVICGKDACRTQRLVDGKPAAKDGPLIQIGGLSSYRALCRDCYNQSYGTLWLTTK